ncbi:MAG: 3-dehydroquinate synthase [Desulfuromonadaceae bacterium]|nr:3-dehydroquinate synthase [Desulfuromonadaceae bacterium]
MKRLTVGLGDRSYAIHVGEGILNGLGREASALNLPRRVVVVTNTVVAPLYLEQVQSSLQGAGFAVESIVVQDGEAFKNAATLDQIYTALLEKRCDRKTTIVALGGGVIGDMAGYAAATYLRGVPFIQVPTTVLSQVDSSVGGKTAINHPLGKNMIGAFYQPRLVLIDVATLDTLDARNFSAGIAEVIKYGVIADAAFFDWLEERAEGLKALDHQTLIETVLRCCAIKADIVAQDETEQSVRAFLNYGHTFGHAIEQLSGYGTVLHGEAVAVGMTVAAQLSHQMSLCTAADVERIVRLIQRCGLSTLIPDFSLDAYLNAMMRDKKVADGALRVVLNHGIGQCDVYTLTQPRELFAAALQACRTV